MTRRPRRACEREQLRALLAGCDAWHFLQSSCEWDPARDQPADADHGCPRDAELSVGVDGKWHLCKSCASLPRFNRFRKRIPLRRPPEPKSEPGWWAADHMACDRCGHEWCAVYPEGTEECQCSKCGYEQPVNCAHTMRVKMEGATTCADCGADLSFVDRDL